MANWFLDLFGRRKRTVAAAAKLVGRGSAAARPRSRLLVLSRLRGATTVATRTAGPTPTRRQYTDDYSDGYS